MNYIYFFIFILFCPFEKKILLWETCGFQVQWFLSEKRENKKMEHRPHWKLRSQWWIHSELFQFYRAMESSNSTPTLKLLILCGRFNSISIKWNEIFEKTMKYYNHNQFTHGVSCSVRILFENHTPTLLSGFLAPFGQNCETLENSSNMPKIWQEIKKSLVQLALNTFFAWFQVPENPIFRYPIHHYC